MRQNSECLYQRALLSLKNFQKYIFLKLSNFRLGHITQFVFIWECCHKHFVVFWFLFIACPPLDCKYCTCRCLSCSPTPSPVPGSSQRWTIICWKKKLWPLVYCSFKNSWSSEACLNALIQCLLNEFMHRPTLLPQPPSGIYFGKYYLKARKDNSIEVGIWPWSRWWLCWSFTFRPSPNPFSTFFYPDLTGSIIWALTTSGFWLDLANVRQCKRWKGRRREEFLSFSPCSHCSSVCGCIPPWQLLLPRRNPSIL